MTLTVTDLFSGGGGLSEGLRQAGFTIAAAANHWPLAIATHKANHPDTWHDLANLSEVDWRRYPRTDILAAAPSCVWHARAGGRTKPPAEVERLRADAGAVDRATAFAVIAATEVHQYDAVIVENVPEFQQWTLYPWWLDGMRALGYQAQTQVVDAAELGTPQRRKRFIAVFTRDGNVDLTMPGLPPVSASTILDPDPGKLVTRRMYITPQLEQIVESGVPHLVTYRRNAHARRADLYPLATITAGGNHHGIATHIVGRWYRHRMLTNRECARGQGFPDTYQFAGTPAEVKKQIGNAVAVPVARWLGERIAPALSASLPATLAA